MTPQRLAFLESVMNFEIVLHRMVFYCWRFPKWRFVLIIFKTHITKTDLYFSLVDNRFCYSKIRGRVKISLFSVLLRWSSLKNNQISMCFFFSVKVDDFDSYVCNEFVQKRNRNHLYWLRNKPWEAIRLSSCFTKLLWTKIIEKRK